MEFRGFSPLAVAPMRSKTRSMAGKLGRCACPRAPSALAREELPERLRDREDEVPVRVGPVWSVRVGARACALGSDVEDGIIWFWIGTRAEYDRIVG